jgi:hypothetical protein
VLLYNQMNMAKRIKSEMTFLCEEFVARLIHGLHLQLTSEVVN